jgi:hypothetical protein
MKGMSRKAQMLSNLIYNEKIRQIKEKFGTEVASWTNERLIKSQKFAKSEIIKLQEPTSGDNELLVMEKAARKLGELENMQIALEVIDVEIAKRKLEV